MPLRSISKQRSRYPNKDFTLSEDGNTDSAKGAEKKQIIVGRARSENTTRNTCVHLKGGG
jgi:hypothetical protein